MRCFIVLLARLLFIHCKMCYIRGLRSSAVQNTGASVSNVTMSDARWFEVETIVSKDVRGVPSTAEISVQCQLSTRPWTKWIV